MSGGLESVASELVDHMIPGLHYKLGGGASYIIGRRFATFYPQGSNIYTPTGGTRLMRFVLSDATNLLDLSTFRLAFELTNNTPAPPAPANAAQTLAASLFLTGHPGQSLFQRVRIYVGGCLCEDIYYAHRVASMLDLFKPPQRRWSERIEQLPGSTDAIATAVPAATGYNFLQGPQPVGIPGGQTQTIISPIFAGIFQSHYLLPGRFPLTIELELVANASLCCASGSSQDFAIENARILCDVVMPDPSVQDELSRVLLAGGALPMHFTSYNTVVNSTNLQPPAVPVGAEAIAAAPPWTDSAVFWSVTISRAYSRIKDIWITFDNDAAHATNPYLTEANCFLNWHGKSTADDYKTLGTVIPYNPKYGEKWRFQMTTGSLVFPDLPMTSSQEAWYQLSKTLGMHSSLDGTSIGSEWLGTNYIIALDMEKMNSSPGGGANFTGLSTRNAGDTIRFAFDNVTPRTNVDNNRKVRSVAAWPTRMFTTIHMDLVLELRAEGCILLD
jgi:hypothetical protein